MARFTVKDLRDEVQNLNECLAHGTSGFLFLNNPRNGMQAVDLLYVCEQGFTHSLRNAGAGSSQETYSEMYQEYKNNYGKIFHHEKLSRKMAKTMLARSRVVSFEKDVIQLTQCQREVLSDWAKVTGYRKSKTSSHSTGAAFFLHLKNRVKV